MCPPRTRSRQLQAACPPAEPWQRAVCRRREAPSTLQCTEDPGRPGNLSLGNLSGLVQARRKLKNFPTKTFTSRGDKKQLRVINPCQHQDPEVRLQARRGINMPVLRVRNAGGEMPGHQGAQLPHKPSGHGSPRGTMRRPPEAEARGSCRTLGRGSAKPIGSPV